MLIPDLDVIKFRKIQSLSVFNCQLTKGAYFMIKNVKLKIIHLTSFRSLPENFGEKKFKVAFSN